MGKLSAAALLRRRGATTTMLATTSQTTLRSSSSSSGCRPTIPAQGAVFLPSPSGCSTVQVRHATYVMRSRRPYQFTQLVQLSDGSTYTVRTTSPDSLLRSDKDTRNHMLWQPSDKSLRNVELDEAGKLAAFRSRFGRGWDLEGKPEEGLEEEGAGAGADAAGAKKDGKEAQAKAEAAAAAEAPEEEVDPFDSLADLISGYATQEATPVGGGLSAKEQAKKDKKKKK